MQRHKPVRKHIYHDNYFASQLVVQVDASIEGLVLRHIKRWFLGLHASRTICLRADRCIDENAPNRQLRIGLT